MTEQVPTDEGQDAGRRGATPTTETVIHLVPGPASANATRTLWSGAV